MSESSWGFRGRQNLLQVLLPSCMVWSFPFVVVVVCLPRCGDQLFAWLQSCFDSIFVQLTLSWLDIWKREWRSLVSVSAGLEWLLDCDLFARDRNISVMHSVVSVCDMLLFDVYVQYVWKYWLCVCVCRASSSSHSVSQKSKEFLFSLTSVSHF